MRRRPAARRGQSLVELAVTLPILVSLAFGGLALARLAYAKAGLDAATSAAAQVAARQPDRQTAADRGAAMFVEVAAGYPLTSPSVRVATPEWQRGYPVIATASAEIDLGVPTPPGLPAALTLHSVSSALIEPYRSKPQGSSPNCAVQCLR